VPEPHEFIEKLRECLALTNKSIECLFLNACETFLLAQEISQALPELAVISWETKVADKAASAFALGFYSFLGRRPIDSERTHFDLAEAYEAGIAEFTKKYKVGDPFKQMALGVEKKSLPHGIPRLLAGRSFV